MDNGKFASTLTFGVSACALGWYVVASSDKGIRAILFGNSESEVRGILTREFPNARLIEGGEEYQAVLDSVRHLLDQPGDKFELSLDIEGTDFDKATHAAVRLIPPGKTATLLELTQTMWASPESAKYAAEICANDVFAVAVPWHRVVTSGDVDLPYRWGEEIKQALRRLEGGI